MASAGELLDRTLYGSSGWITEKIQHLQSKDRYIPKKNQLEKR